jgi:hypothetical protein
MRYNKGDKVRVKSVAAMKNHLNLIGSTFTINSRGNILSDNNIVINAYMQESTEITIEGRYYGSFNYDYECDDDWNYCDWMLE